MHTIKNRTQEDEIIEDDIDLKNIETIYGEGEAIDLDQVHNHGHSHGGGHGHSHGGGHGHSHGGHGHSHGNGHSHGPVGKDLTDEERESLRSKLHARHHFINTESLPCFDAVEAR